MNARPQRHTAARFAIVAALVTAALLGTASVAFAASFDPLLIISNDNMRHYDSMSQKEIQAFLETQDGPLADLVTSDYDKVITLSKTKNNVNTTPDKGEAKKRASQIIWEACRAWKISPKVMLTMLQKEQSLLTTKPKPGSSTLARAVGAGCPGSLVFPKTNKVATNRYPGFGNQIWHGARLLSSYGEGHSVYSTFSPGLRHQVYKPGFSASWVYKKRVRSGDKWVTKYYIAPKNLATYKLYVYNPSIGAKPPFGSLSAQPTTGNANFWKIYSRYFGSPLAHPRVRPVYRFRNRLNGTYLYTASITERLRLKNRPKTWAYDGGKFAWDTSVETSSTKPMYRFYNRYSKKYSYTSSHKTYKDRRSAAHRREWNYQGIAWRVSRDKLPSPPAQVVYRLKNRYNGGSYLTASKEIAQSLPKKHPKKWRYDGVAFYMPRYTPPTP